MGNPQVKDALNVLANIGNVHVWQRVQTYADPVPEVPAGYTLGAVETDVLLVSVTSNPGNQSKSVLLYYDSSLDVTNDGIISVSSSNYVYANVTNMNAVNRIVGQFVSVEIIGTAVEETDLKEGEIYYVPEDCEISYSLLESPLYIRLSKVQRVTGHPYQPSIPAGTHVDYLTSTDPNAYPKQSAEGGQDAHYVLGDVVSGTIVPVTAGQVQFKYSTTVTVYDNGDLNVDGDVVNLQNYNTEGTSTIKGKYIVPVTTGASISGVWFISSDATFSLMSVDGNATKLYLYCDKMQPVTGYPAIPANTVITYLGQLGEPGAKIEVGSYVGTGTSSATITLGYQADFLAVFYKDRSGTDLYYHGFALPNFPWSTSNITMLAITNTGFTVRYNAYGGSLSYLNSSGATYVYIAFRKG